MKKNHLLIPALLFFFLLSCDRSDDPEKRKNSNLFEMANHEEEEKDDEHEEEIELADYMAKLQRYHHKLYLSGKANNTELTNFYLHEIQEVMEEIEEANITEEGIAISAYMKTFGLGELKKFGDELKSADFVFEKSFNDLTAACNSCHQACKEPQIRIITPKDNPFSNQDFSAQ